MKFKVILEPEEGGGYSVHCPALKGCHSQGETAKVALANIKEAFCGLKPTGVGEFSTSSHDLKVVAINCNNCLTLNLYYNPL